MTHARPGPRLLLPALLAGALLVPGALLWAPGEARAADLSTLQADLNELESRIKSSKSINEDIQQYLTAVAASLRDIKFEAPPEAPADLPEGASEEQAAEHAKAVAEHKVALAEYEKRRRDFDKDFDKKRKEAFKLFFRALELERIHNQTNMRDLVNRQAADLIGELGALQEERDRKGVANDLIKVIGRLHKKKDPPANTDTINATFTALARLGREDDLKWMADNYIHTKEHEKQFLIAAHKAMILYEYAAVDGQLRFDICEKMITIYSSVEAQAEQSSNDPAVQAKKRFWDAIRTDTIPCVQHFAGQPKNAEGAALAKMAEFQEWWRDHKNPRKPPWKDA